MEDYNVFAGAFVDRSGERRKDTDWLAEAMSASTTRFVPVWGDRCLVGEGLGTLLVAGADGLEDRTVFEVREEVVDAFVSVGVGTAHEAISNQSDAQRFFISHISE